MTNRLILLILLGLFSTSLAAQDYDNSIGFRTLGTNGFTYKRNLNDNQGIELLLGFGGHDKGIQIFGIYQWYLPINTKFTQNKLFLVYGTGGHFGYARPYVERYYYTNEDLDYIYVTGRQNTLVMGVDGIVGLEYRIYSVPMTIGFDLKPSINYYGFKHLDYNSWDAGFSVKYIF